MNKQKPPFERLAVFLCLIVIERNDLSAVAEAIFSFLGAISSYSLQSLLF
jgi:hypothetical protein